VTGVSWQQPLFLPPGGTVLASNSGAFLPSAEASRQVARQSGDGPRHHHASMHRLIQGYLEGLRGTMKEKASGRSGGRILRPDPAHSLPPTLEPLADTGGYHRGPAPARSPAQRHHREPLIRPNDAGMRRPLGRETRAFELPCGHELVSHT
jgi:hypothetical protein